ncbi:class I SAM-dependent methyltransferase [Shewanella cyperi]|uniref:Class I SAM-dependent methyltransferase n=1 Tax=Shewanella cyperi TaxID=2814292 RepID=A0A975AJ72_9GAMM|nr:class I SAM-dependent methyltransferase [Shewanella cyperi]QSX28785.1 class I SAM-dependent methyltransferase [Shewanella cyperi]
MDLFVEFLQQVEFPADSGRMFHGRGGLYPGVEHLCLDWYEPVLLLTSFSELGETELALYQRAISEFWLRHGRPGEPNLVYQLRAGVDSQTLILSGAVPEPHIITEQGLKFQVHLLRGQNHGLFLDMRAGRQWVREQAAGKNVLNLFAYTCGFSVAALAGGADNVVNMDMAKGALAIGKQNHLLNGFAAGARFLGHDIFKSWGKLSKLGPYDLIIADPPSNQKGSFIATKDYVRLLRRLPELLTPGGDLLLCLNAPELGCDFLAAQVQEAAPQLEFIERLANPAIYADMDEQKSLKVLRYSLPAEQ